MPPDTGPPKVSHTFTARQREKDANTEKEKQKQKDVELGGERREGRGTLAGLRSADHWLRGQGRVHSPQGQPRRAAFGFRLCGCHLCLGNHMNKRPCVFLLQVTWLVVSRRKVCRPALRGRGGGNAGLHVPMPVQGLAPSPSDLELTAEAIYTYFQKKSLRKHGPADSTPSLRSQVDYILSLREEDNFV